MILNLSFYIIPLVFLVIVFTGASKNICVYDEFVHGAKEGILVVFKLAPTLIGLLLAVGVFRASEALNFLVKILFPLAQILGIPTQIIPLAILRPISGSASLALLSDILKIYSPDSIIGRLSSTIMGSTETIFYTLAVYFGAVGIKNSKYAILAALIADVIGVIAATWICNVIF